ncbi:GRIP1-associated protein 1-like isoform X2 [Ischnura elegans]|uniref:GRIP1-associated protein 1-like isoform X2 n=1 Tax=Ischnura elegans TaxID=197161 RepID=UPI001ED8AFCF|nr:GRIP1-associated protein 1-like isoform X2 [Ischnura elegans]
MTMGSRCQQLQSQVEALERECFKAHSSLNFAKKLKSADLLSQNERLQQKLQAQEDEFRLQNQTLLQELSSLTQENEKLSGIVKLASSEAESAVQRNEQVRELESEASALQRALSEERLRSAHEVSKLKGVLKMFSNQMDETLRIEVFGCGDLDAKDSQSDANCSGGRLNDDAGSKVEECAQVEDHFSNGNSNDVKLVSTCRLAQLELAEAMQETERLKEEKEKRESLENSLTELQSEFSNYKVISEKKIEDLEDSLQLSVSEQENQLCIIHKYTSSNSKLETQVEQLKCKVNELELENEVLHAKNIDSMKTIEDLNQKLSDLTMENQENIKSLAEKEKQMFEEVERLSAERKQQVESLEQQLADMETEQSLRERKGAVVCRDLRRQLAAERKRVERLQERMREVLEGKMGAESAKVAADIDVTSISSWSLMSGNLEQQDSSTRESSLIAGSPTNMNGNPDDLDLEQESRNLLERVASLQEEKWALEEKVNQLEQGNAAMVQDLMKKSKVIQFYCMDGRQDPLPSSSGKKAVKKLSDFLKNSEEEHLQECNARMQRMLEELLTKNMYLQRDMEQMSKEFEKLKQGEKLE